MPRPRIRRRLQFCPRVCYFKPQGNPLRRLAEVILESDELEVAKRMEISQPTFARTLNQAYKKIAEAIIKGKAIRIGKRSRP